MCTEATSAPSHWVCATTSDVILSAVDLQGVLRQIHAEVQPLLGTGRVADYIPALAGADARAFGMAMAGFLCLELGAGFCGLHLGRCQ